MVVVNQEYLEVRQDDEPSIETLSIVLKKTIDNLTLAPQNENAQKVEVFDIADRFSHFFENNNLSALEVNTLELGYLSFIGAISLEFLKTNFQDNDTVTNFVACMEELQKLDYSLETNLKKFQEFKDTRMAILSAFEEFKGISLERDALNLNFRSDNPIYEVGISFKDFVSTSFYLTLNQPIPELVGNDPLYKERYAKDLRVLIDTKKHPLILELLQNHPKVKNEILRIVNIIAKKQERYSKADLLEDLKKITKYNESSSAKIVNHFCNSAEGLFRGAILGLALVGANNLFSLRLVQDEALILYPTIITATYKLAKSLISSLRFKNDIKDMIAIIEELDKPNS